MVTLLLLLAFICFVVSVIKSRGNDTTALGLAFWVLTLLLGVFAHLR